MKILDIALKDLSQSFRSAFALVMMFVVPALITAIMYLAFGGLEGEEGIDLPVMRLRIINLDQAEQRSGGFAVGQALVGFLRSEEMATFLRVAEAPDASTARAAVDRQEADLAIIIPPDFSKVAFGSEGSSAITLYQDPTLTIGPGIVNGIVSGFVDGFAGTRIAVEVVLRQFEERGLAADAALVQEVTLQYANWARAQGAQLQAGTFSALDLESPPARKQEEDLMTQIMAGVMVGMMIFFVFFTGAATAESIVREDEEGTLARLFITPTPRTAILGGKLVSVFLVVSVQVVVLLLGAGLVFGIDWGKPASVALVTLGLVVSAAGFGVFIMSLVKSTRQSGPVMGGVLTLTGALGGLITPYAESLPEAFEMAKLFTPQGWALRSWQLAMAGSGPGDLARPVLMSLLWGVVTFAVGVLLFRKRFA